MFCATDENKQKGRSVSDGNRPGIIRELCTDSIAHEQQEGKMEEQNTITATERLWQIYDGIDQHRALAVVLKRYVDAGLLPAGSESEEWAIALGMISSGLDRLGAEALKLREDLANGTQMLID